MSLCVRTRAFRGRVPLLHHQPQRHSGGQGARPGRPHWLAARQEEIWGEGVGWKRIVGLHTILHYHLLYLRSHNTRTYLWDVSMYPLQTPLFSLTGSSYGCWDQFQKHQTPRGSGMLMCWWQWRDHVSNHPVLQSHVLKEAFSLSQTENWDGLHQSPGGKKRLWHSCQVPHPKSSLSFKYFQIYLGI